RPFYIVQARDANGRNLKRKFERERDAKAFHRQMEAERAEARQEGAAARDAALNPTVDEWSSRYLAAYVAKPQTKRELAERLARVCKGLGDARLRDLDRAMIGRWV